MGGTAGPPTGHMVIVARSRSIHGPWENAPDNPIVRTRSADGEMVVARTRDAIEGARRLLVDGLPRLRERLLDAGPPDAARSLHWTADGWLVADGGDLSQPIAQAARRRGARRTARRSRTISRRDSCASQWAFYDPAPDEAQRLRFDDRRAGAARARAAQPRDARRCVSSRAIWRYEFEVEVEVRGGAQAGVLLFYNRRLYCGLGFDAQRFTMHRYGLERTRAKPAGPGAAPVAADRTTTGTS